MQSTLSPEIETFRRTCRLAAERHFRPLAEAADAGEIIPHSVRPLLADLGAYGLPFSSAVGGSDGSFLAWSVLHEEIGRVMPVLGMYFQVNTMVAGALLESGSPDQVAKWVPSLL